MKQVFVKDLKVGDTHQDLQLLIDAYEEQTGKNGSKYIRLVLRDNTGKIDGKIWNNAMPYCAAAKRGDVVRLTGTIDEFNGALQIIVAKMIPADQYDMSDYIATATRSTEDIVHDIEEFIESIENKHLKNFLKKTFEDKDIRERYFTHPAGKTLHHAYRSGLADHVLDMLQMAQIILQNHPLANKDIVYTGIILHDFGKIVELEEDNFVYDYSLEGNMLGHIFIGANWFNKHIPEDFPEELRIRITHIILSHHGKLEYGSPVTPKTYEAHIVRHLDEISSSLNAVSHAYEDYNGVNDFSDRILSLNNEKLYLRPVAV